MAVTTPILTGDLRDLARLMLTFQPSLRKQIASQIVDMAVIAHRHFAEHGRSHPDFGNGSIMAAARQYANRHNRPLADEPRFDDPDYIDTTIIALEVIRVVAVLNAAKKDAA